MKKLLTLITLSALLLTMTSCDKDKGDAAFKLDGINLNGIKYLALGSNGSGNTKGEDIQKMLYSIDESGNMQLVAYNYQCDDDGLVTEIQRNIGITITQVVPVGDRYIWLVGCRYYCDDYSGFSESMQSRIRSMVNHSIEYTENFLIRKSDGKIFDLNGINAFPLCIVNVPGYGNAGVVGIGGFDGVPLDGDLTGDRLRKLGLICQHNGDIYLAGGTYYGGLSRLHDNGSSLSVMDVMPGTADQPINIAYAVTDNNGHLGTCISYGSNQPHVASIMAPDGTLPAIQGIQVAGNDNSYFPTMRCIGGKYFVSVMTDEGSSIYLINTDGNPATATKVANGYFGSYYGNDDYQTVYISDEENYSWTSDYSLFTFNSNTYQITENTLPSDWPTYSEFDAEGFYYKPNMSNGLQSFTIYNLATVPQTEEVTCNRSEVPAFNFLSSCNYDGGLHAFIESVIMADGSTVTIVTPVTGSERGISRIQSQTNANNNVEVGTLIPLN